MTTDRVIAQVQVLDYAGLLATLRERVEFLDVPNAQLEELMDLQDGYLSKLLGAAEVRRIGLVPLWKILDRLGLRMVLVEHLDRTATLDEMSIQTRARKHGGSPRGKLRKTLSPAIIHAAAQCYGAMGAGVRKTFRKEDVKFRQRRAANRSRWKKYRNAMATQPYNGRPI